MQDENTLIQLLNRHYIAIPLSTGAVRGDRPCPLLHYRGLIILYHKNEFSRAIFFKNREFRV